MAYWITFMLIIIGAIALRGFWTVILEVPYVMPDTWSYLAPIVSHPHFPFSQTRTAGAPLFIEAGIAMFRGPWGILIFNNILALASAVTVTLAVRHMFGQRLLSLVLLVAALFTAKGIMFEYLAVSEHYSRCLYLLTAALVIFILQTPARLWLALALAATAVLNVLVKPSALVVLPAVALALGLAALRRPTERRALIRSAAAFLALSVTAVGGYMAAFNYRFGSYDLTHFDGYNLFSHVGHLMVFDKGEHLDLKRELQPLMSVYIRDYASQNDYLPNWLVFGSAPAGLSAATGGRSPPDIIGAHATKGQYGTDIVKTANQLFRDLALEGMREHPIQYATYVARGVAKLWMAGWSFSYSWSLDDFATHRRGLDQQRAWLFGFYQTPLPPCGVETVPANAAAPMKLMFAGPLVDCKLPHDIPALSATVHALMSIYHPVSRIIGGAFLLLPGAAILAFLGTMIGLRRAREAFVGSSLFDFAIFLAVLLSGYSLFLGLVNISEPPRMTTNVQDLAVLLLLLLLSFCLRAHFGATVTAKR